MLAARDEYPVAVGRGHDAAFLLPNVTLLEDGSPLTVMEFPGPPAAAPYPSMACLREEAMRSDAFCMLLSVEN